MPTLGKRQDTILTFLAHMWPSKMAANALVSKFAWSHQTKDSTIKHLEDREYIENSSLNPNKSEYQLTPKGWYHLHINRRLPVVVGAWECYICEAVQLELPAVVVEGDEILRRCPECKEEWMGIPHEYKTRRSNRKDFKELYTILAGLKVI